jgi:hypothetical protein
MSVKYRKNPSTSNHLTTSQFADTVHQMPSHLCICGCEAPVKPGQRWHEPACKARAYRVAQRMAHEGYRQELEDLWEEQSRSMGRILELMRQVERLEEAYSILWEEHQDCPSTQPDDTSPRPWFGDAYAVLGVRADAEWEAIEGAYKGLTKKYHPDRHPGDPVMDARMKAITAAYTEVLRLRGKRRRP